MPPSAALRIFTTVRPSSLQFSHNSNRTHAAEIGNYHYGPNHPMKVRFILTSNLFHIYAPL